jgi:hypothetical protein
VPKKKVGAKNTIFGKGTGTKIGLAYTKTHCLSLSQKIHVFPKKYIFWDNQTFFF